MKRYLLAAVLLCMAPFSAYSQLYKQLLPSREFTKALESVVLDFRLDYKNIQRGIIDSLGEMETYESSVILPGAAECKILRFHSYKDTTACFQAIIYSGEDYKEAVRAYENTVKLLKKSRMQWIDRSEIKFIGEFVRVREDLRFTTSTLTLTLDDPRYRDFRAEVELIGTHLDRWEVQLNLSKKTEVIPGDDDL